MPAEEERSSEDARELYFEWFGYYPEDAPWKELIYNKNSNGKN